MTEPNNDTEPFVGISNPAMMASKVVFPEPDGPTKDIGLPDSTDKLILLTIVKRPSGLLTSFVMSLTSKIKSFNGLLIAFSAILLLVTSAVNSSENIASKNNTIVILGDSLSAGYGVKNNESWPSLLQSSISNENLKLTVINAGISGDTTSGGLYRLPLLLDKHKPKLVILELGGNDGLRGMSINKVIKKNLEEMINMSHGYGAIVVLIGVQLPPNYGKMYTNNFEQMFIDLALKYDLVLVKGSIVDMISSNQMQSDGIHPNQAGHVVIEKEIWRKIKPILESITD